METAMVRIKTAITLEKELLDWIDSQVKEGIFSSRSHAIRYAVIQLKKKQKE
jgi:Arc/MetJ-type ribon-helix-helix transcriptional regulator